MVKTVTRSEPLTWFSTPEGRQLQLAPDGGFIDSDGCQLITVRQILDRVYPLPIPYPYQQIIPAPAVVAACINHANSLYNPAPAATGPLVPTSAATTEDIETIEPLIAHPFWQHLEVLATDIPLRHRRLPVATSVDLLVRFRNGGDIGLGICQTHIQSTQRVAAELGAAIALLNDTHSWWPRRAFVLFCHPGKTIVEVLDADTAVSAWIDALDIYRHGTNLSLAEPL